MLTVTWGALTEGLPTDGEEGWDGGGRENVFRRDVIAVMVKVIGSELGNACSFIRTLPHGDKNDWLLKERLGRHVSGDQLCSETTKATCSNDINNINITPRDNVWS